MDKPRRRWNMDADIKIQMQIFFPKAADSPDLKGKLHTPSLPLNMLLQPEEKFIFLQKQILL
jgi:hypothetical protein